MLVGYARVSAQDQDLTNQVEALKAAGCTTVYSEKASGVKTDRAALAKAIAALQAGDVLLVVAIDRLARSTRDLLNTLAAVADRGAGFKSLRDPWVDTTSPTGTLLLQVLAALAQFERSMIRSRCADGMKRARARGQRFGRPFKLTPHQQAEALARKAAGEAQADIARLFNVSQATISRLTA